MAWLAPETVRPYLFEERWREYYSPTYDLWTLAVWACAAVVLVWDVSQRKLWRRDRDIAGERPALLAAWALPPTLALFVFYTRTGNIVTRYAVDFYPAFAAAALCVGSTFVAEMRRHRPRWVDATRLALAVLAALWLSKWRGWPTQLSKPADRNTILATMERLDQQARMPAPVVPDVIRNGDPRISPPPVHSHLLAWSSQGFFLSGVAFALPYSPCVTFTFAGATFTWQAGDQESLDGLRATADFDSLRSCGVEVDPEGTRQVTMCEPHPPAFVLDGMRLYSIATLDPDLHPHDRLRLLQIQATPSCLGVP
jgi:hypothetical protein